MRQGRRTIISALPALLVAWAGLGADAVQAAVPDRRPPSAQFRPLAAPPGFEDLLEPQTTLVDIYRDNKLVGTAPATFSPGQFQFNEPKRVITLLPELSDAAAVIKSLSGPLDPHPALLCTAASAKHCQPLRPEIAGIVFNSQRFRVDLYVNPALIQNHNETDRHLPLPERKLAAVQTLTGAISGLDNGETTFNLWDESRIAFGEAHLHTILSLSSADGFRTDAIAAELDHPGVRYSAGIVPTTSFDFITGGPLLGIGVETTTDTMVDVDATYGNQLTVFLPDRSQVEIFRGERLLSSGIYGVGNHVLDTTALPSGTYEITLKIRGSDGHIREERRTFTKSADIPLPGSPIYFAQLGYRAEPSLSGFTEISKTPVLRTGTRHRITDNLAAGVGFLTDTKQVLLEASTTWLSNPMRVRAAGIASTTGLYGASVNAAGEIGNLSYSMGGRLVWGNGSTPLSPEPLGADEMKPSAQLNLSLNYPVLHGQLGFQATWRHDRDRHDSYSIGPNLFMPLLQEKGVDVALLAQAIHSDRETIGLASVRISWGSGNWTLGSQKRIDSRRQRATGNLDARTSNALTAAWNRKDLFSGDLSATGTMLRDSSRKAVIGDLDYRNDLAHVRLGGEHNWASGSSDTRYSGTFQISGAGNLDAVAVGGRDGDKNSSAIIVKLDGNARNTDYQVIVNERPYGPLSPGEQLPIYLRSYEVYNVHLKPIGSPLVNFDQNIRSVPLYPGNATTLSWTINQIVAVYGRILHTDGTPVANAPLTGVIGIASTDDRGFFQAEISDKGSYKVQPRGRDACTVQIAFGQPRNGYANLGDLICR